MYTDKNEDPVFPDFEIPKDHNFQRSPEEIEEHMQISAWEFEMANRRLRKLEVTKTIRYKQVEVILLSRKIDLLKSENLKKHLALCFEDPKFKFTNETLDAFAHVELREIMDEYNYYEKVAKQAEKENEMWGKLLMFHQSKNKLKGIELMNLRG